MHREGKGAIIRKVWASSHKHGSHAGPKCEVGFVICP